MAALTFGCRRILGRIIERNARLSCRLISSSSEKKNEKNEACPSGTPSPDAMYKKIPDFSRPQDNKNWVSYGSDLEDEKEDRYMTHVACFVVFTMIFAGCGFIIMYYPDKFLSDWAHREAFIVLHEREMLGLDPIDMNYVDPSKIVLPRDEDLCDEDIII